MSRTTQRLRDISVLCHANHSLDDPFYEVAMFPKGDQLGAKTTLEICPHEVHVGFVNGTPWCREYFG